MTAQNLTAEHAAPKPPSRVLAKWTGGMTFESAREGGPALRMDGTSETGQSPVDILLSALAGCAAIDVVEILKKQRTPVESLEVEVIGERVDTVPRRFKHITLNFRITGAGIDQAQAERAISLSINKYCSVGASLSADIAVDWTLTLGSAPKAP
jgi:Predicted redox protein, regulator of disulfide bond formation